MDRSPHRRRKVASPVSTPQSGRYAGQTGIWLPLGKKAGKSHKPEGGGQPGKRFRDPQGRWHTIPDKGRAKRRKQQKGRDDPGPSFAPQTGEAAPQDGLNPGVYDP
jgi:hypothetical protein